jgi:predicted acetyltransferase
MIAEGPMSAGIEVLAATAEQEPVVANLLEFYTYDFSEFLDLQLRPDGRFGAPGLSRWWQEEGRFPFLVTVDGHLAGFAFVMRGSRISGDPAVWDMAEFFIARRYRRRGIGAQVAREVWRRFPGAWEVRVMESNVAARGFWAAAVAAFTGTPAEAAAREMEGKRWEVFSFTSPGSPG